MANWLEEMIARIIGGGGEQYPGYTTNRMMANQGPMGTPMQSPDQFDVPFRAPYGGDSMMRESDISRPLGAGGNFWNPSSDMGIRGDLITRDEAQAAIRSRANGRDYNNVDSYVAGYAGPGGIPALTKEAALRLLLESARRSAEKEIEYDQSRRTMAKYK